MLCDRLNRRRRRFSGTLSADTMACLNVCIFCLYAHQKKDGKKKHGLFYVHAVAEYAPSPEIPTNARNEMILLAMTGARLESSSLFASSCCRPNDTERHTSSELAKTNMAATSFFLF